eukprot:jgi/Botrbrau1/3965/Bobra.0365s0038.1
MEYGGSAEAYKLYKLTCQPWAPVTTCTQHVSKNDRFHLLATFHAMLATGSFVTAHICLRLNLSSQRTLFTTQYIVAAHIVTKSFVTAHSVCD